MSDETVREGGRATNQDLRQDIRDLGHEINGLGKMFAGMNQQVAGMSQLLQEIKASITHAVERVDRNEREIVDLGHRVRSVEKSVDKPLLTTDEVSEIRRMLTLIRVRGVVDILTPDEVDDLRDMLKRASERETILAELRARSVSLEEWRSRAETASLSQATNAQEMSHALQDMRQRVDARRTELNEQADRLVACEQVHSLTDDELAQVRNLVKRVENGEKVKASRRQTIYEKAIEGLVWVAVVVPCTTGLTLVVTHLSPVGR